MGTSTWTYKVNLAGLFRNDEMTFAERRDAIVRTLRASRWLKHGDTADEVRDILDELATVTTPEAFDALWADIYSCADLDGAWITTA